jgi:hypothetical protein
MIIGIILLCLIFVVLSAVVLAILDYFGNRQTYKWFVWLTAYTAYLLPLTVIFILPVDLVSVIHHYS